MPQSEMNLQVIDEFRKLGGKTTGQFKNSPLLLLTTTGAKTGEQRTTPLVYSRDGDDVVILASRGGAPTHPAWYLNLAKNPDVTVELGTETFQARATVAEGEERKRLFAQHEAAMPGFEAYQAKTTRQIPVVILRRQ